METAAGAGRGEVSVKAEPPPTRLTSREKRALVRRTTKIEMEDAAGFLEQNPHFFRDTATLRQFLPVLSHGRDVQVGVDDNGQPVMDRLHGLGDFLDWPDPKDPRFGGGKREAGESLGKEEIKVRWLEACKWPAMVQHWLEEMPLLDFPIYATGRLGLLLAGRTQPRVTSALARIHYLFGVIRVLLEAASWRLPHTPFWIRPLGLSDPGVATPAPPDAPAPQPSAAASPDVAMAEDGGDGGVPVPGVAAEEDEQTARTRVVLEETQALTEALQRRVDVRTHPHGRPPTPHEWGMIEDAKRTPQQAADYAIYFVNVMMAPQRNAIWDSLYEAVFVRWGSAPPLPPRTALPPPVTVYSPPL